MHRLQSDICRDFKQWESSDAGRNFTRISAQRLRGGASASLALSPLAAAAALALSSSLLRRWQPQCKKPCRIQRVIEWLLMTPLLWCMSNFPNFGQFLLDAYSSMRFWRASPVVCFVDDVTFPNKAEFPRRQCAISALQLKFFSFPVCGVTIGFMFTFEIHCLHTKYIGSSVNIIYVNWY